MIEEKIYRVNDTYLAIENIIYNINENKKNVDEKAKAKLLDKLEDAKMWALRLISCCIVPGIKIKRTIFVSGNESCIPTHTRVEWLFPEIYDNEKVSTLILGLSHTRSADDIRIKYSADRDGWIIEQASVFEWGKDDVICDPDWQEVAFISAWAREKKEVDDA
jgi:hypothetical protein